jgi:phosphoribosyl-ATP pyrophosphohydrolase
MTCEDFLARLYTTIRSRKGADPKSSYVASLFGKGRSHIAKKLGEEATETVIAASGGEKKEVVHESADLLFHLMVLWADCGIIPEDVLNELKRREGTSGLEEKANRKEIP